MKWDETQLQRAATLADHVELSTFPDKEDCPEHTFSPEFEANMQTLIQQVKLGEIKPYRVSMGYSYYAKRGIAAVLIGCLLTCIAMPGAVIAGYHKLIDFVEHVVTEYTEYKYHSYVPGDATFTPLQFGYLPEGMELEDVYVDENELYVLYRDDTEYFILDQMLVTENSRLNFIVDTEDAVVEKDILKDNPLIYVYKEDMITYIWTYEQYHISGSCNFSKEELDKILTNFIIE